MFFCRTTTRAAVCCCVCHRRWAESSLQAEKWHDCQGKSSHILITLHHRLAINSNVVHLMLSNDFVFPFSFTARITELMRVLKELNSGKYERTMVSQSDKSELQRLLKSKTNFKELCSWFISCFLMSRCFRKAHTDTWKWKNHQCRQYHQVRAASFSPLSQIECFTVRRNNC